MLGLDTLGKVFIYLLAMLMDLNRVMLIGRVASDIEVRKMEQSGNSVVNLSIVTNRRYKNRDGQAVEEAEFHRVVAYGNLADLIGQYLQKWRRVYAEGRLRTRKWEVTAWTTRYSTEIILDNIIFLDSKNGGEPLPWNDSTSSTATQPETEDEELPF